MRARLTSFLNQNPGIPLIVLALAVVLVGLAVLRRDSGNTLPAEGGTLVEHATGPAVRVNPLLAATPAERDLAVLVFAGLTRPGPGGEAIPDLAEEWRVSDDGRSVTFDLRRDLSWHDGAPLSVADVVFTLRLIQSGAVADQRLLEVWRNATVTQEGPLRLRVQLPAPFAALPAYAGFGLLPEHLLKDVEPSALGDVPFNRRPVGSGPFRLLALEDDGARLARYDRYHLGAPYLDAVQLRFGEDDADASVLGTGAAGGDRVTYPMTRFGYGLVVLNNDSPLFAADTVRRALSLATDRRGLAARTLGGRVAPVDVPFAPGSWAHDGEAPLPQNLEQAKALLASAGWAPGPDGILRRGNRELRFTLVTADEPAWTAVARTLAESWGALGARVVIAPTGQQTLLDEFLTPRQYEAALVGWDPGLDPDPFSGWHSSLRGTPAGNPANFADERSDALLLAGRTLGDDGARRERYVEFQTRFRELAPSIVLFAEAVRYAVRPELQLSLPASVPEASGRFSDVRRWHLQTRSGP